MKSTRNQAALLLLASLLLIVAADELKARWLFFLSLAVLAFSMGFLAYQIGIKKDYQFLANNFGVVWGNFVAVLLVLAALGLALWVCYLLITGVAIPV